MKSSVSSIHLVKSTAYQPQTAQTVDKNATPIEGAEVLRHQETALVRLGELYRDQKYVR